MKKFLYCTTALAVAGAFALSSGDANAAAKKIKIGVGGFMASEAGFGSNEGAFETGGATTTTTSNKRDSFNTVQDSEIYFTGSTKLDNGATISVTVQLEGDQANAADIDESYMKITGGFGDIRLGSVTGPVSTLKKTAPYVGFRLDGGDTNSYITVPAAVTASASTNATTSGDANKIIYISPKLGGGLQLGVAYTPSTTAANTAPIVGGNDGTETQVYEASLSFESKMGSSDVKLDIGGEHVSGTSNNTHRRIRGGINVTAGGVTVGGAISKTSNLNSAKSDTSNTDQGRVYDLGIKYATGAYTFGIAMTDGELDTTATSKDTVQKWGIGMQYNMSEGVDLMAGYYYADFTDSAGATAANNNSGHAVIGKIKVSF
jgi:outer membrane protein OmpU